MIVICNYYCFLVCVAVITEFCFLFLVLTLVIIEISFVSPQTNPHLRKRARKGGKNKNTSNVQLPL